MLELDYLHHLERSGNGGRNGSKVYKDVCVFFVAFKTFA